MRLLLLCLVLSSCSLFRDDEEITIRKPEPGTRLIIEEKPLPNER